jgi:hypothetical protein
MPVYFFHVKHEEGPDEDFEGMSFDNVEKAITSAAEILRDVIADELRAAREIDIASIEITDQTGTVIATVTVADAVVSQLDTDNLIRRS